MSDAASKVEVAQPAAPATTAGETSAQAGAAAPAPAPTSATINRPIVYNTSSGSLVYDVETQKYWIRLDPAQMLLIAQQQAQEAAKANPGQSQPPVAAPTEAKWFCIHTTPKTVVSKEAARSFLKAHPTFAQMLEQAPKLWPTTLAPSPHGILTPTVVLYNALHDSLVVRRDKADSGLAAFAWDKVSSPYVKTVPPLLNLLRPEFTAGCGCGQLQTYGGAVVYCAACTTWRAPITVQLAPQLGTDAATGKQAVVTPTATVGYRTLAVVGRLTFDKYVGEFMARTYCADAKTGKFAVDNTLALAEALFHLAGLRDVPVPRDVLLGHLLRDSLFVRRIDDKVVSWADHFKVREVSFGAADALTLVRIGLAIGTLGAIS